MFYSLVFNYLIDLSDKHTAEQLDHHIYNDEALIEISIPLNMPYVSNQNNYERYDGSIEVNGMHYNYVKRKISNDTLHILCIPNEQKTQLHETKNNYSSQLADASNGKKENQSQVKKLSFFAEYSNDIPAYALVAISSAANQLNATIQYLVPLGFVANQIKPPEVFA